MNRKDIYKIVVIVIVLILATIAVLRLRSTPSKPEFPTENEAVEEILPVDSSVSVDVTKSRTKVDTIILIVKGMQKKYVSLAYELTYESDGLIKGVNTGSKPIQVNNEDGFEREIFLGTCSRNVCKPDKGVEGVSLVLEFTDLNGKKSEFTGDFTI